MLGALVVTQLAVVAAGQDDETMRGIARVRRDRREELWYRQQRRLDGLGEIEARIAEEQIAGDHHHGRVVDVVE